MTLVLEKMQDHMINYRFSPNNSSNHLPVDMIHYKHQSLCMHNLQEDLLLERQIINKTVHFSVMLMELLILLQMILTEDKFSKDISMIFKYK